MIGLDFIYKFDASFRATLDKAEAEQPIIHRLIHDVCALSRITSVIQRPGEAYPSLELLYVEGFLLTYEAILNRMLSDSDLIDDDAWVQVLCYYNPITTMEQVQSVCFYFCETTGSFPVSSNRVNIVNPTNSDYH